MRILITGVAGFIGSNLAQYLINKGYNVAGIDDLSYGVIEQVPSDTEFHKIDILSEKIYPIFKGVDVVFHLAAKNCIPDCQRDPLDTVRINILGSINVFEACRKASINRIIYAESSAIYEGSKIYPTPESDEKPESFYAISKYAKSFFSKAYHRYYGLNPTALRYFNVYGPRQDYRRSIPPLMSSIIINLLKKEKPKIYGDGSKRRDFIYVDDVNRFHEILLTNKKSYNRVFNIGTGINYSVNEIYSIIDSILKTNIKPIYLEDLPGEAFQNLANIDKAKSLGWEPKISIEEGLKYSIRYLEKLF